MTTTVEPTNGHQPSVTVAADVQMCVRTGENPAEAPIRPDPASGSAFTPVHTRAISQEPDIDQGAAARSKVRDAVSLHAGAVRASAGASWFGREQPPALFDVARDVVPGDGFDGNWAALTAATLVGILRLAGLSLAYLVAFCFATRIRAAVSTAAVAAALTARVVLS